MRSLRRGLAGAGLTLLLTAAGLGVAYLTRPLWSNGEAAPREVPPDVAPPWAVDEVRTLPQRLNSLAVAEDVRAATLYGMIFAGTQGNGGVYRIVPPLNATPLTIAEGLGDLNNFGQCYVNRVALHDVDGDGEDEILASTSQVQPPGRPRLIVWSSTVNKVIPRAVARPEIRSNWSHSLAFLPRPGLGPDSLFITFCGNGEVVEYRMKTGQVSDEGFRQDELGWKQVGQLPASGEWVQVADADNDGRPDVCLATGFAEGKAAVLIDRSPAPGAALEELARLDEGGRFGNVRFVVAALGPGGERQVVAWWCTGLGGGDTEMIAYRLGPGGVRERTVLSRGPSQGLWPDDGQFTTGDLDGDGRQEVWFATNDGHLWRYAPPTGEPDPGTLSAAARFPGRVGALTIGPERVGQKLRLFMARGKTIYSLRLTPPPA